MFYNTLGKKQLQPWFQVEIVEENDSKVVYFHSKIHVNKVVKITWSYCLEWSDGDILNDEKLITKHINMYG